MAVEAHEIRDAIERPREKFWSERTGSEWRTRGRITVPVAYNDDGTVTAKTVLWSKPSGWAADALFDSAEGRNHNDLSGTRRMVRAQKRNRH